MVTWLWPGGGGAIVLALGWGLAPVALPACRRASGGTAGESVVVLLVLYNATHHLRVSRCLSPPAASLQGILDAHELEWLRKRGIPPIAAQQVPLPVTPVAATGHCTGPIRHRMACLAACLPPTTCPPPCYACALHVPSDQLVLHPPAPAPRMPATPLPPSFLPCRCCPTCCCGPPSLITSAPR